MRNVTIVVSCLAIFIAGCGGFDSKDASGTQKETTVKSAPTQKSGGGRGKTVGRGEESESQKEAFARPERAQKSGKGPTRIVGSGEKLKPQKATTTKFKRGDIHKAARAGDLVLIKKLIAENPEAVNERANDWTKETPIFNAILFDHYDVVVNGGGKM
jgi:hypothetical protein